MTGVTVQTSRVSNSLLDDRRFRRFCVAEAFSQVGDNAFNYALLVMVVGREPSAFFTTLLVISFVVPSLLVGLGAGIVVDRLPRRLVLVVVPLVKVTILGIFLLGDRPLGQLYALAASFAVCRQFYGPAVSAAVPALAAEARLVSATAMMGLIATAGQGLGMVILAPLALKTVGEVPLLVALAGIFFAGGALLAFTPGLTLPEATPAGHRKGGMRAAMFEGVRAIRADAQSLTAMTLLTLTSMSILILVPLVPIYTREVAGLPPENSVFLFTPAVIGVLAGLRLAEPLSNMAGRTRLAVAAFVLFVGGIATLGFVEEIAAAISADGTLPVPVIGEVFDLNAAGALTVLLVVPLGFVYALVLSSARAELTARSAVQVRGRVFATQVTLANLVSVPPLLLAGALTDVVGAQPILLALALICLMATALVPRLLQPHTPGSPAFVR